jgi:DNA-binding transcriptional LysR family regulator
LLNTQKAYLSRVVTKLEGKLGVRLLERTTRSLSLTEVGREIFERAVGILGAVEDTERVAQQMLAEPRGVLKLTCGVEFGMIAVSGWINTYLRRYPQVNVEADFTGRVVEIVHEGFDLAIRLGELPDSRLAARRLGEIRYGLFASPDYLKHQGIPDQPDDLASHDLLSFSGGADQGNWRLGKGEEVRCIDVSGRLKINNSFAVRDAAIQGLGIAKLPLLIASASIASGELIKILAEWVSPAVPVHAVFPSSRYLTPKVRAFIDNAAAAFSEKASD